MAHKPITSWDKAFIFLLLTVWSIVLLFGRQPVLSGLAAPVGEISIYQEPVVTPPPEGEPGVDSSNPNSVTTSGIIFLPGLFYASPQPDTVRLNIPRLDGNLGQRLREAGIFWFGRITPTENYSDVRVSYSLESIFIAVQVFDRLLWSDSTPSPPELPDWDAVSIYLSTDGNHGASLDAHEYKFVIQVNSSDPLGLTYRAMYQGNGNDWNTTTLDIETRVSYRSSSPPFFNDQYDDHGWMVTLEVPYSSLGLASMPSEDTNWGLSVRVHDRDDEAGMPIPDKVWPTGSEDYNPASWGRVVFGLPSYTPPPFTGGSTTTIRHGVDGVQVMDGMVGGNTTCGENLYFWTEWGNANYDGAIQVNVQSQWDVADQPCFSKYYITMPIDRLPQGKVIVSASLTLYQFGNSNPQEAMPSMVQAFTIAQDWDEATLNWNNAPQMVENVSRTRVEPLLTYPGLPGVPNTWDVSLAVARAYLSGQPLRLAFYEADAAIHSGKYFHSSDVDQYIVTSRPLLTVVWGNRP